LNLAGRKKLE